MDNIKILVTLGPQSLKEDVIKSMADAGVYLFRINMSHTEAEQLDDLIPFIQSCTDVPVCLDSEGAQVRTQRQAGGSVSFDAGAEVQLHFDTVEGDTGNLSFYPPGVTREFEVGDLIDIDFHGVQLRVRDKNKTSCTSVVEKAGKIGENKGVFINRPIALPAMTDKDKCAIEVG